MKWIEKKSGTQALQEEGVAKYRDTERQQIKVPRDRIIIIVVVVILMHDITLIHYYVFVYNYMESLAVLIAINTKVLFHVWRYGDLTAIACVFYFNSQVSVFAYFLNPDPCLCLPFTARCGSIWTVTSTKITQNRKREELLCSKHQKNWLIHMRVAETFIITQSLTQSHWLILTTYSLCLPIANRSHSDSIWFIVRLVWNRISDTFVWCRMNNNSCGLFLSHFNSFRCVWFLASKSAWIKNILCDYVKENALLLNMMYGHFNGTSQDNGIHEMPCCFVLCASAQSFFSLGFFFFFLIIFRIRLHHIIPLNFTVAFSIRIDLSFSMHTIISIHQLQ